jgi:hypothetical protein
LKALLKLFYRSSSVVLMALPAKRAALGYKVLSGKQKPSGRLLDPDQ